MLDYKQLSLDQALAMVSDFGIAVLMPTVPEQRTGPGMDWLCVIKADQATIINTWVMSDEAARKFRLFKRVLRKAQREIGLVYWLQL